MVDTQSVQPLQRVAASTARVLPEPRRARAAVVPELLPQSGNTTPSGQIDIPKTAPIRKPATESLKSFKVLESWVARVETVDLEAQTFTALVSSEIHTGTREAAEFTFDEISEDDRALIQAGAIFYWSVGYQIDEFGGRSTASVVRFRRVHHWRPKEIREARARASEYADWFLGDAAGGANGS